MEAEKAKEFLLALNDKDARDAWKAKMAGTKNDGEALAAAVDLARDMGFDVTVEDITAAMNELKAGQREKTQQAVADIQALEDNALEDIAGGQVFWVNPLAKIIKREYIPYGFLDIKAMSVPVIIATVAAFYVLGYALSAGLSEMNRKLYWRWFRPGD